MRKVLVFVLALAMILGSFSFAFAAEDNGTYSDVAGTDCEGAVTVLSALGVVNGYADGTYKPENIVTRAEMAKLLIVALGLNDYVGGSYANYSDVPGSHWATSHIAYAASMGIIEGYPDGTFKPDNTVTYQEAATMIVRALGYQDQYLTGTWPASHVSKAKGLGILDGIVATADGANRGDVALMLYNAIDEAVVTYDSNGNIKDNDNMLERLGATAHTREVLTADGITGFGDFADGVDLSKYYGYSVVAYTIEDDDDNDVIVAVGEIKGTAYEVELTAADKFEYNDKEYTIDAAGVAIVNNHADGTALTSGTDDDASMATIIVNGSLTQSGTDLYSAIQWKVDEAVYIEDTDVEDIANAVEDKDDFDFCGTGADITYDDDDEAFDLVVDGAATDLSGIKENDVVFVYVSGGDVEKITVAREVVEGTVSKVNSDGDKFTVDSKAYEKTSYESIATNLDYHGLNADAVGDDWTFYLDPNGKIFVAESVDEMGDYALLIAKEDNTSFGTETDSIKVMDNTGAVVELDLKGDAAADVTFTGVANFAALDAGDIITYATNSAGKVTEIEKYTLSTGTNLLMSKKGVYDSNVASAETVIFTFSGSAGFTSNEDDYDLGSFAKIAGETFDASYVNDNGDIVAMIVGDTVGGTDDTFGIVNSYTNIQNADEDKVYEYDALVDGKAVTLTTDGRTGMNVVSADGTFFDKFFIFTSDNTGVVTDVTEVTAAFRVDDAVAANDKGICALAGVDFLEVTDIDKTAGWIEINSNKYSLDDKVTVYKMDFVDDEFDSYVVGSMSNVAKGAWVVGFDTTDDDEDMIDTIMVVTRADYAKYKNGSTLDILDF